MSLGRSSSLLVVGQGCCHGSFGELLQGALAQGKEFLVTLPIALKSRVTFIATVGTVGTNDKKSSEVVVYPSHKRKAGQVAARMLNHFKLPHSGYLLLESELPEGKGLASSTADLVATIRAIKSAYKLKVSHTLLFQLLREVEPSDGVMYTHAVAFFHREVKILRHLGKLPPLMIVAIDDGGVVDTIEYNKRQKSYSQAHFRLYKKLLESVPSALSSVSSLGKISTKSAYLNQEFCPKKKFEKVITITKELNLSNRVVVAHSGTFMGVMLSPLERHYTEYHKLLSAKLKRSRQILAL
ncbi:MAG: kinase [Oligoflexia bacterium]|nr:kinase [Oligoflexia bacterium]MBF0366458.1 kinase [Oligoflexia bacterium]